MGSPAAALASPAAAVPAALFVALLWGVQPVIHKHLLARVDPRVVMAVGAAFYLACVAGFAAWNWGAVRAGAARLSGRDVAWIGAASVLTAFVANVVYLYVLRGHDSYVVSALIYASPVFTLALAALALRERVTPAGAAGVLLIVAGVLLLALNERSHHGGGGGGGGAAKAAREGLMAAEAAREAA